MKWKIERRVKELIDELRNKGFLGEYENFLKKKYPKATIYSHICTGVNFLISPSPHYKYKYLVRLASIGIDIGLTMEKDGRIILNYKRFSPRKPYK